MRIALKYQAGLLAIVAAGVSVVAIVQGQDSAAPKARPPKSSELVVPKPTDTVVVEDCDLHYIDSVMLSSPRPGIVEFVPEEGDEVTGKKQVAGLVDRVAQAAYEGAKIQADNDIEVRFAKKSFELADVEYKRALLANKRGAGNAPVFPEIEVAKLQLAADKALLQIEHAEYQLEIDRHKRDEAFEVLQTYKVEAPFDGTVTQVVKHKGEGVREGEPLLEIVSPKRVRVVGYISLKDNPDYYKEIWAVKEGALVKVKLQIRDVDLDVEKIEFEGRLRFVDSKVTRGTKQIRVWAEVVNKDNILRDGLRATMTIFPGKQASLANVKTSSRRAVSPNAVR